MIIRRTDANESQIKQQPSHMPFDGVVLFSSIFLHNEQ